MVEVCHLVGVDANKCKICVSIKPQEYISSQSLKYCRSFCIYILQAQINLVRSRRIYSEDCVFPVYIYPLNDPQLALYMDQNISSLKKPPKLFSESFMKFSVDFVCQFCWRIDCRADERRDTGEILENGRDFWFRINRF